MKEIILVILFILDLSILTCCVEELDYFRVLGITKRTRQNEIKRAFRSISKRIHPDKNQCDPKATEKFLLLTKAFETLYNEDLRSLYRARNPMYGYIKQSEYDWDLPECSNTTDYQDGPARLRIWFFKWARLFFNFVTRPATVALNFAAHLSYLLVTSSTRLLVIGICLYYTSYTLCRSPAYQFFLLFVLIEAILHVILAAKISILLPSLLTSWQVTAVALLLIWACYISVVINILQIIINGISMWNLLYLQNYVVYFILYTCGALVLTIYYFRKYPVYRDRRYIEWCGYVHCAVGLLLVYVSIPHTESAAVVCVSVVSFTWFLKISAPLLLRLLKFMIKMIKLSVIALLRFLFYLTRLFANIFMKFLYMISIPLYTVIELPVTVPKKTWKLCSFVTKCAIHSLIIGMREGYLLIKTKMFSKSFNQRYSVSTIPRRLLSRVEYILEGRVETRRQLNELRRFCKSPIHNSWKTALSLQNLERFIGFVNGQDHLTQEEKAEHERTGTVYPQRDDSDDSDNEE